MRRCVEGGVGRWPQHTDKYEGVAQLANHSVGIPLAHGSLLGRERERKDGMVGWRTDVMCAFQF